MLVFFFFFFLHNHNDDRVVNKRYWYKMRARAPHIGLAWYGSSKQTATTLRVHALGWRRGKLLHLFLFAFDWCNSQQRMLQCRIPLNDDRSSIPYNNILENSEISVEWSVAEVWTKCRWLFSLSENPTRRNKKTTHARAVILPFIFFELKTKKCCCFSSSLSSILEYGVLQCLYTTQCTYKMRSCSVSA